MLNNEKVANTSSVDSCSRIMEMRYLTADLCCFWAVFLLWEIGLVLKKVMILANVYSLCSIDEVYYSLEANYYFSWKIAGLYLHCS